MQPERLARTTVSVCFAGMAGAIVGIIAGALVSILVPDPDLAAMARWPLLVAGVGCGIGLGWRWAVTMPMNRKVDSDEADYGELGPPPPVD